MDESLDERRQEFSSKVTLWHQFRALFLKDLSIQTKALATNICQLLVPIVFLSFAVVFQVAINSVLSAHPVPVPGTDGLPLPVDAGRPVPCQRNESNETFGDGRPSQCYQETFSTPVDFPYLFDNRTHIPKNYSLTLQEWKKNNTVLPQMVLFDLPFYYVAKGEEVQLDLGNISYTGASSNGFIDLMVPEERRYNFTLDFEINPNYMNNSFVDHSLYEGDEIQIPFFLSTKNSSTLNQLLIEVAKEYNSYAHTSVTPQDQYDRTYSVAPDSQEQYTSVLELVKSRNFSSLRPHGGVFVDKFNVTKEMVAMNYTVVANALVLSSQQVNGAVVEEEVHRRNSIINLMNNAFLKNLTNSDGVPIVTYIAPLPGSITNLTIDIATVFNGVLYPFAASFLLPVFTTMLVSDKFQKQLIMMEQNGLDRWTYWLVTYVFNYCIYVLVAAVIFTVSFIYRTRLFTQTNWFVLVLVFALWGHGQVVLGFFLSNLFSRPRTSTIVTYLIVVAQVIVALLLEGLQVFPNDATPFPVYMMYPPFAFYRVLFYLNLQCFNLQCYSISVLGGLNLVTIAMLYLAGFTVVFMIASAYLSYVIPGEYGVRLSPFFPIIGLKKAVCKVLVKLSLYKEEDLSFSSELESQVPKVNLDPDVQQEEEMLQGGFPPEAPVVIFKLRKEYPAANNQPPHVAVHSFSLAIQRNECFGLLGPNGAGKTTLISVLTGLYEPTSGIARICGYDISSQMRDIHRHLGVCPQFDIQYPQLTAEEHLLFYARLKGVRWRAEKRVVEKALRQVNLFEARKKRSSQLSGGMRRRLSVAMACIGYPEILVLDEPTTGLDPASRRQVWEVVEAVKEGRSVVLTTHAMDEADHLCTRIGIMNHGVLRCLGTQTHLKSKFGSGYQLKVHCAPGRVQAVKDFINSRMPNIRHVETYADSCTYNLERQDLVVSELFTLMDSSKDEVGIADWGIKMTTLEDVFLNIVESDSEQTSPVARLCPHWLPCLHCCNKTTNTSVQ